MAQLRQDYQEFIDRDAIILVIGPEGPQDFEQYWDENQLPFPGLPDPDHTVLKLYGQEIKLFKLGRMPAQVIVDKSGTVRFVHYGDSMSDIPSNEELMGILDKLNEESLQPSGD
jgi:peroxiredoxin